MDCDACGARYVFGDEPDLHDDGEHVHAQYVCACVFGVALEPDLKRGERLP